MEKQNNWAIAGGVLAIAAVIVIAVLLSKNNPVTGVPDGKSTDHPTNVVDSATTGGVVDGSTNTTTTPTTKASVYSNSLLSVNIPAGWTATEAPSDVNSKSDGTEPPSGAKVNITKGKWILYINVDASQASGVEGGRFAEIGMGAPSVDAVVQDEPNECGKTTKTAAFVDYSRVDYTMNASDKTEWCVAPTNGKTVWFFSYLTSPGNGFFNDYVLGQNPGLVVTMAYNGTVVNDFPIAGSAELTAALKEMTDIASTLKVKNR